MHQAAGLVNMLYYATYLDNIVLDYAVYSNRSLFSEHTRSTIADEQ